MTLAGLGNEMRKLLWRRKYRGIIALDAVFCVAFGLLSANSINIGGAGGFTFTLPNVIFSALTPLCSVVLPLVIFMMAADMYTGELENKTIKCCVTRPVSRFSVFLSKFLAMICYSLILLAVSYVVLGGFYVYANGVTGSLVEAALAYLVSVVPLMGFAATAAFISVAVPNPSMAMFLSIIAYVLMLVAGLVHSSVGAVFFTSYLGWYKMWVGSGVHFPKIAVTLSLILSYSTVFFVCGYLIFDKKDI